MTNIIERIERKLGIPGLAAILAQRLAPTDLQSLLLEVYRLRLNGLQPAEVLSSYRTNRFVQPARSSPLELLKWEQVAFEKLPSEFLPLELSPVSPLGTNSVVAPVDPGWSVATIRNSEVVSDSTNVLALECSSRRKALLRADPKSSAAVHLAASHRLLRAQNYQNPKLLAHFSIFALCSAGRDQGNLGFELSALCLHIRFYLSALRAFLGAQVPLQLSITDFTTEANRSFIDNRLLAPIQEEYTGVQCAWDDTRSAGRGYYHPLCFHIHTITPTGQQLELVDGGALDWTQKYLSNAKERLIASGIASERVCSEFKTASSYGDSR
jgi:hypothetical protein